jgi:hypothetical protein|tara:strand:- start:690 stop:971 length:282 start_codon:yes stop_codon:yes gene_type:complete
MKNRKLLLAAIVILSIGLTSFVSIKNLKVESVYTEATYCDGWKAGYEQGWCYEIPNCIKPIVPICPIAKVNQNRYVDGYNRGFIKGRSNRQIN